MTVLTAARRSETATKGTVPLTRQGRLMRGAVGTIAIVILVEVLIRTDVVDSSYFPAPSTVLVRTGELLLDPDFLSDVGSTLIAAVIGLILAALIAIPLGIALGSFRYAYAGARSIVEMLRPIPSVALVPLAILLFGGSLGMKVSLIVYAAVWPILFNAIYGAHDVDKLAIETARSFGMKRGKILLRVTLPHAAPFIATGVRISAAIALVLAITAEFLGGGRDGLGKWLLESQLAGSRVDLMFAGILVAGVLGVALSASLSFIEGRLFPWYRLRYGRTA